MEKNQLFVLDSLQTIAQGAGIDPYGFLGEFQVPEGSWFEQVLLHRMEVRSGESSELSPEVAAALVGYKQRLVEQLAAKGVIVDLDTFSQDKLSDLG